MRNRVKDEILPQDNKLNHDWPITPKIYNLKSSNSLKEIPGIIIQNNPSDFIPINSSQTMTNA